MNPNTKIPTNSLPGPDNVTRVELPNGIIVLARSSFATPSFAVSGYLNGGSIGDPDDRLGLAQFTALALTRGTQRYSFQDFSERVESAGASIGFGAGVQSASFSTHGLAEDFSMLLELLGESLFHPTFPEEQIRRLQAQLLTGLDMRGQDTAEMADLTLSEALFPNHPYGRPEDGYPETVRAIQREDLQTFHRNHYGPRGMVFSVVGALDPDAVVDQIERVFGSWKNPEQMPAPAVPPNPAPQDKVRRHVPIPGKSQTDIAMGVYGPKRTSEEYVPALVANNILGQFGMMGRIGEAVRENAGLAYYATSGVEAWTEGGAWQISAGVNPANVDRAIDLILDQVQRFVAEPVTPQELEDSTANITGRLPLSLESNAGVAGALLTLERFQLGLDYYQRYPEMVRSVTRERILEVARQYLNLDRMAIITAGP
jgi:zinc protease